MVFSVSVDVGYIRHTLSRFFQSLEKQHRVSDLLIQPKWCKGARLQKVTLAAVSHKHLYAMPL